MTEPIDDSKDEPRIINLDDLVVRSDALSAREAEAGGPAGMITQLSVGLKRQQRVSRWLAGSLIFDIVLSIVLGIGLYYVDSNRNIAHTSCVAGNSFRRDDHDLWLFYLRTRPALPGLTSAQQKVFDDATVKLKVQLDATFASRECP